MISKSTIKFIQSLQQKKNRDEHKLFIAEGPKLINELLTTGTFSCQQIYSVDEKASEWMWAENYKRFGDSVVSIRDFELEKISSLRQPNQALAVFEQRKLNSVPDLNGKLTLLLDDIRDPGNLGTIIRIADWFGIENIICSAHTAELYNPKVVQSTMASLGRVNIFYVDILEWLPKISVKKYATTLNGTLLTDVKPIESGIIIIGNESHGVSEPIQSLADSAIRIPGFGSAESLNAAVAAGIILYHCKSRTL